MKNLIIFMLILFMVSCTNYRREAEQLQAEVDSLRNVTAQREATIETYRSDFAEIQRNLDSLRKSERMIAGTAETERRLTDNHREQILTDIEAINTALQENQEVIASMRRRINNSNIQSGKLEAMVNDLEKQSKNLEQKLQQRDTEVGELSQLINKQRENIDLLQQQLDEMTQFRALQTDTLQMRTTALNRAYYTVGTISELRENNIVDRQGGILGIGSTPVVRRDFPQEEFTEVDIRRLDYVPLDARRAELITIHPEDSYHISGDNQADTLFIEDPRLFWAASRYLVVAVR
jgi:predicted RNase H-like nuclease (RuvC/YqgF family)